jgi:hypothetical protein
MDAEIDQLKQNAPTLTPTFVANIVIEYNLHRRTA